MVRIGGISLNDTRLRSLASHFIWFVLLSHLLRLNKCYGRVLHSTRRMPWIASTVHFAILKSQLRRALLDLASRGRTNSH